MMCSKHQYRVQKHGDPHYDAKASRRDAGTATCVHCGETKDVNLFVQHPNGVNGVTTVCKACKAKYDAAYRETHRDQRREAHNRRKAIIRGIDAEKIDSVVLWAKTDGICELCDIPVDPELKHPDPMSPSIDHIIPLSRGGTHTTANTRITHLVCNVRRGAARGENF